MQINSVTRIGVGVLILVFFQVGVSNAQIAVGVKAGTAGLGGEVATSINNSLNVRLSGTFFSYEYSGVYADDEPSIAYNALADITSVGALIDYFPFKRGLKISAGIFYHDFSINGEASPNEDYVMGDKTFSPEKLGSLTANIDYESKLVPYAGIGLGNPLAAGSALKLSLELGALYTKSPQVTMQGEGMIAPTANQGQDFENGLQDFKFYPVFNLALTYRFL